MNSIHAIRVGLALLCVVSLGTAAASLDSTLATDPDDIVDPDWRQLPLSEDEAGDIKEEIENNEPAEQGVSRQAPQSDDGQEPGAASEPGDQADGTGSGIGETISRFGEPDQDPLDRLLALLRSLLPVLFGAFAVLVVIGLGYRYRDRITGLMMAIAGAVLDMVPARSSVERSSSRADAFEPKHAIDRAWLRLIYELDLDGVQHLTPKECARLAKESGMPRAPVDTVTETFEEVRYGGRPLTDERCRRVEDGLRALGLEGGAT